MTIKLLLGVTLALSLAACGSDSDSDSSATTQSTPFHECNSSTCTLYGRIEQDFTLTADKTWLLTENVVVGNGDHFLISEEEVADVKANGVTLTIEPGTHVQALDDTSLTITRGSKIMAAGTPDAPIIFSHSPENIWDGLTVQGFAPVYPEDDWVKDPETEEYVFTEEQGVCGNATTPCNMLMGSDKNQYYGGMDIQDNSGVLSYVIFSGPNRYRDYREGITLLGTGSATEVNNIQISGFNSMTITGGGTNISQLFMVQRHDSEYSGVNLELNSGYKGNLQHLIISGLHDAGYIMIKGNDTEVTVSNALILPHSRSNGGILFQKNPTVRIYNSILYLSPADQCLGFDLLSRIDETLGNDIDYENLLSLCSEDDLSEQITGDYPIITASGALTETLTLYNIDPVVIDNGSDFTLTGTEYLGPVEPGTAQEDSWWADWVLDDTYELASPENMGRALAQPHFVTCQYDMSSCSVMDRIDMDYTLDADVRWVIRAPIYVGFGEQYLENEEAVQDVIDRGVTLTIQPGTNIFLATSSSLTITRGSKINAKGTVDQPIIIRSNSSQRTAGIRIQGFAPVYTDQNCAVSSEDGICNISFNMGLYAYNIPNSQYGFITEDTGYLYYGGDTIEDSSGEMSHIIFKSLGSYHSITEHYLGYHPAISLMGVGYNTDISNIQIDNAYEKNQYSGLLISGGTVNLSNIIDTHSGGLTVINGYKGNIQNLISINSGERSFIQNENSAGEGSIPSQVAIANFLAIGESTSNPLIDLGDHSDTILNNGVITDSSVGSLPCLSISDYDADSPSNLDLLNLMDDCTAGLFDPVRAPDSQSGVVDVSESGQALSIDAAGVAANSGITATGLPEVDNGSGFEFEDTDYMGAVAPETAEEDAWWYGWTEPGSLDSLSN